MVIVLYSASLIALFLLRFIFLLLLLLLLVVVIIIIILIIIIIMIIIIMIMENIEITGWMEIVETTALLRSARTLRRVLET